MGASECDHLTFCEHHVVACGWISSSSLVLVLYAKFTKAADQNVLASFQSVFDLFQQNLY
jgi:hypothetical protein